MPKAKAMLEKIQAERKKGGLKRWSGVSKAQRSRIMREVALKRYGKN